MSEHYPRIRIHAESGALLIRDSLSITFYMCRPHEEVASAVMRSLDTYLRSVGPNVLGLYADEDGYWQNLDEERWALIRNELLNPVWARVYLADTSGRENRYHFAYRGMPPGSSSLAVESGAVSVVSFWLPTEFLEEHGPGRVRELALELATPLPFCSGHAGLSFNCDTSLVGVAREVRKHCFRYPGMDIPDPHLSSWRIGTKVREISWLNFLGQPVLSELGGAAGLRSRLSSPGTTVQDMEGERAVITLGRWPEAGDMEQGDTLPAYRELARVLEPWLYRDPDPRTSEETRRWERRFLD
jgi:TseV toxin immunity protein TsiV